MKNLTKKIHMRVTLHCRGQVSDTVFYTLQDQIWEEITEPVYRQIWDHVRREI
jgi:hypothetical protein